MSADDQARWSYALAKQLGSAHTLASDYGELALDDELRAAVEATVRPILQRRMVLGTALHREALDLASDFVRDHDPLPTITELAELRGALRALARLSSRLNLDSGAFCCFSCGAKGGDILAFHRLRSGLDFREVIRDLAEQFLFNGGIRGE
jgi:hypothetical protein